MTMIKVKKETHNKIKIEAAKKGVSMIEFIDMLIKEYIEK